MTHFASGIPRAADARFPSDEPLLEESCLVRQASPRLSVCIPTHHGRGEVLQEAIDSVLAQLTPSLSGQVQICISDNASEDGTQALVESYSQQHPGVFVYHRHPVNLGFTQNVLSLIQLAQGDYCWLLSSDDALAAQALARVLDVLARNPSLAGMTVNLSAYDSGLTRLLQTGLPAVLSPCRPDQEQVFTSPSQILRECGSAQGCFSMQVFDRKLWQEAVAEMGEAKYASFQFFPYLFVFGKMVKKRPQWLWMPEALVKIRSENDYLFLEMQRSLLKYQTNILLEVSQVWGELLGRSSASYQSLMRDNYRFFWAGRVLLNYKIHHACTTAQELRAISVWTRTLWFLPDFWAGALPVLLTPHMVLRAAHAAAKHTGLAASLRVWKRRLAHQELL